MRGPESVVYVEIGKAGELLRELLVVGLFLRVKTEIFQKQSLSFL
jgi:hypothetical protein